MSDAENNEPSNANGKRINALELGPRKKAYVVLVHRYPHHSDNLLLAVREIR